MLRSLNFWLFLLVLVCGVSFWAASGSPLPAGVRLKGLGGHEGGPSADQVPLPPVHLKILNGTDTTGLARQFSLLVAGRGCVVENIGNSEGPWPESLLINRRMETAEARDLARKLGVKRIIRQWDERLTEDAVLVLGDDFESLQRKLAP